MSPLDQAETISMRPAQESDQSRETKRPEFTHATIMPDSLADVKA
jgi:hypothetical protein